MHRILIAVGLVMLLAGAQCSGASGPPQGGGSSDPK